MFHTLVSCLNRQVSDVKVGVRLEEKGQAKTAVYRDELAKKQAPIRKAVIVKKSVRFADSEPTILADKNDELEKEKQESDDEKRRISSEKEVEGIRVKVKMTKEEAARLISKCKEGGFLEFRDVARELVNIPIGRVCFLPTSMKKIDEESLLDKDMDE